MLIKYVYLLGCTLFASNKHGGLGFTAHDEGYFQPVYYISMVNLDLGKAVNTTCIERIPFVRTPRPLLDNFTLLACMNASIPPNIIDIVV